MAGIFIYAHDCKDFSNTGLVGELHPIECMFSEEKNGSSELSIRMYYDADERWKSLKVGNIVKAQVPVRVPPVLVNGQYLDTVDISYVQKPLIRLDLQRHAIRLNLQKHAMWYNEYYDGYGDKDQVYITRKIPYSFGETKYEIICYSDGTQVTKIVDDGKKESAYVTKTVTKLDERTIPQRFSGLEAVMIPTRLRDQFL